MKNMNEEPKRIEEKSFEIDISIGTRKNPPINGQIPGCFAFLPFLQKHILSVKCC